MIVVAWDGKIGTFFLLVFQKDSHRIMLENFIDEIWFFS
jgi:hypothetical protein